MKKFGISFIILLFLMPITGLKAADYEYDLGVTGEDIFFSKSNLVEGDTVRLYAVIHNFGNQDILAYVDFYQGSLLIDSSQQISVRANGLSDEVFVDWVLPQGQFNIRVEIKGQNPTDENSANDVAMSSLFVADKDTDGDHIGDSQDPDDDNDGVSDVDEVNQGTDPLDQDTDDDGVIDGEDAFPTDPNESADTDNDGIGNNQDSDDDNDGLSDEQEASQGTDPLDADSDDDGVDDSEDYCPGDPTCSSQDQSGDQAGDETEDDQKGEIGEDGKNTAEDQGEQEAEKDAESTAEENQAAESAGEELEIEIPEFELIDKPLLINVFRKNWNEYYFTPEIRGGEIGEYWIEWDFGDGEKSYAKSPEHKFKKWGEYAVTVKIRHNGQEISQTKNIYISFWNFSNPWLIFLLVAFICLLWGLFYWLAVFRNQTKKQTKQNTKKKTKK